MTIAIALYLLVVSAVVVAIILRDHRRGECDLLCIRNVALLGFVIFQLGSAAYSLLASDYFKRPLATPVWTALQFAAMATVFLVVGLWSYRRGWVVRNLAAKVPITRAVPQEGTLLVMSVVVTVLAAGLRLGVRVPLIAVLAENVGTGLAAIAAGLVGWVWSRRLLNPVMIAFAVVIIAANLFVVMYGSVFGRRGLAAVGAALLWGMYWSHWRTLPTGALLRRLAIVSIPPLLFLGLFSSVRGIIRERGLSPTEQILLFRQQGSALAGLGDIVSGQYAGAVSMWLIENYPENFDPRPLMAVRYFLVYPVPRAWWPSKPRPLSSLIASQARLTGVRRDVLTIGPGIVGHAAAEGGWYALLVYAVLAGLYGRFFDEIVHGNAQSPFVVLAVGSALGHVVGIPRGTSDAFAFLAVLTIVGSLACMVVIGKAIESLTGTAGQPQEDEGATWDDEAGEDEAAGDADSEAAAFTPGGAHRDRLT
jgi:hypothetical protein